jgi:hypothetical protein
MSKILDFIRKEPVFAKGIAIAAGVLAFAISQGDATIGGIIAAAELTAAKFVREVVTPTAKAAEAEVAARADGFIKGVQKTLEQDASTRLAE